MKIEKQLKLIRNGSTELKWTRNNRIRYEPYKTYFLFNNEQYKVCIHAFIKQIIFYKYIQKEQQWKILDFEEFKIKHYINYNGDIKKAKIFVQNFYNKILLEKAYKDGL